MKAKMGSLKRLPKLKIFFQIKKKRKKTKIT